MPVTVVSLLVVVRPAETESVCRSFTVLPHANVPFGADNRPSEHAGPDQSSPVRGAEPVRRVRPAAALHGAGCVEALRGPGDYFDRTGTPRCQEAVVMPLAETPAA